MSNAEDIRLQKAKLILSREHSIEKVGDTCSMVQYLIKKKIVNIVNGKKLNYK